MNSPLWTLPISPRLAVLPAAWVEGTHLPWFMPCGFMPGSHSSRVRASLGANATSLAGYQAEDSHPTGWERLSWTCVQRHRTESLEPLPELPECETCPLHSHLHWGMTTAAAGIQSPQSSLRRLRDCEGPCTQRAGTGKATPGVVGRPRRTGPPPVIPQKWSPLRLSWARRAGSRLMDPCTVL